MRSAGGLAVTAAFGDYVGERLEEENDEIPRLG